MNLTLRAKLLSAFMIVLVLMGLMAVVVVYELNIVGQIGGRAYVQGQISIKLIGDAIAEALQVRDRLVFMTNAATVEEQARQLEQLNQHIDQVTALIAAYEPLIEVEGARATISDFKAAWTEFLTNSDKVVSLAQENRTDEAQQLLLEQADQKLQESLELLRLAQDIEDNLHRAEFFEGQASFQRATLIAGSITILSIIIGLGLALWLAQNTAVPIADMAQIARELSRGEFSRSLVVASLERGDEVGILARAFSRMSEQLRNLINTLEQRVASRTRRLERLAVLSERLTAILDIDLLLAEMVNQVKDSFDYYHVHVYLLDEHRQNLEMAAGAGEPGRQMKAQGHQISYNAPTSLVARAARSGQIVRVDNVREVPDWLPNPLLPDTHAEMAVPIILEGQVVGVLDVQEDEIGKLDEGDESLLRSLANQVAVDIRNVRLFAQVQTALADAQAVQERYISQAWEKVGAGEKKAEYHFQTSAASMLDEAIIQRLERAAVQQNMPTLIKLNGYQQAEAEAPMALVAPIKLQDQVIGTLQFQPPDSQPWGQEELDLVRAIVDQVAQTAENLRLFEETREQANFERLTGEITEKLRQAPTLEALAEVAGEELSKVLGVSHSLVKIGEGIQDKLSHEAGNLSDVKNGQS